jgi:hypothetical protein
LNLIPLRVFRKPFSQTHGQNPADFRK